VVEWVPIETHSIRIKPLVDGDQPIDAVMAAQLEYLADALEKVPDP
jgi:hypothetical protein